MQTLTLHGETGTEALGRALARIARPGDVIALEGDLGAGKTTLARAFIRERLGDPSAEVPSPTFTLVQTYEAASGDLWHFDLYRIGASLDLTELGWDEAVASGLVLVEWPDRLGPERPTDALTVRLLTADTGKAREGCLEGPKEAWAARLRHLPGLVEELSGGHGSAAS